MKKRNSVIDIWRFLGCIAIMILHASFLGKDTYPFRNGWIYVEFFYILSGFYTIKHFANSFDTSVEDRSKEAILYFLKKYFSIVKFTTVAFILKGGSRFLSVIIFHEKIDIDYFFGLLLDIPLIVRPLGNLSVLWFVQALLMVFPLFCFLCQIRNKYLLQIISFSYVIFYYHKEVSSSVVFPNTIMRCVGGLFLGILVYYAADYIGKFNINNKERLLFTFLEQGLLIYTLYLAYIGNSNYKFMIVSFFVGLSLTLSENTYSAKINWKGFNYLGEISIIVYIFHSLVPAWLSMIGISNIWIYIVIVLFLSNGVYVLFDILKCLKKRNGRIND